MLASADLLHYDPRMSQLHETRMKLRAEIEGQWGGKPPAPEKYVDLSYYDRALSGLR